MNAPLAARLELEVLHRVRNKHVLPCDSRFLQRAVENRTGRPHKRMPLLILLIPRLLSNEHHIRFTRPFARHSLRRVLPKLTAPACIHRIPQLTQ